MHRTPFLAAAFLLLSGRVNEIEGTVESGIEGIVMIGPTCPVEQDPPDPECADRPYATRLAVTTPDGAQVVREFDSAENGTFQVQLEPGEYAIRSAAAANTLPYCASTEPFTARDGEYTHVDVSCDSGIR